MYLSGVPNAANPVVKGGQLWSQICSGKNKHCSPNDTVDEGTPDIVMKGTDYTLDTHLRRDIMGEALSLCEREGKEEQNEEERKKSHAIATGDANTFGQKRSTCQYTH